MPEETGEITADTLLAAAREFDTAVEAGEQPEVELKTEEPEPEEAPEEEVQPEEPTEAEAEPEPEGQSVDEPESSLTEGETPREEDKPQDSKWAKNEARRNKSWKAINAEKVENKRVREELDTMKSALQKKQGDIDEGKAYRDDKGYTAADYERAAEIAEDDGEYDDAEAARVRAKEVTGEGKKSEEDRMVKEHQDAFTKTRDELYAEHPSLKDDNAVLTKETNQLLKDHPDLIYLPEGKGLRHAVQVAQWKVAADETGKSQAEVKELTDKLNKLEKKMSVGGGFTSEKLDGEKSFDDLSDEAQESYLRKAATELDNTL